ncbi:hypothetical protein [uncultured Acinetobacter sp.]|uniref:hypothetical protein n=1 Tax=uncultured Acinetobacter sp. TaxID=165433 RepID=UPI0037495ACC
MSLKTFSLLEANFTQAFFQQLNNLQTNGISTNTGVISISYLNESNEDTILIGLDASKQGQLPDGANEAGLKAISKLEAKWIGWLDNLMAQYKSNYNIATIILSYDASTPLNVDISIKLKPVSSTQP